MVVYLSEDGVFRLNAVIPTSDFWNKFAWEENGYLYEPKINEIALTVKDVYPVIEEDIVLYNRQYYSLLRYRQVGLIAFRREQSRNVEMLPYNKHANFIKELVKNAKRVNTKLLYATIEMSDATGKVHAFMNYNIFQKLSKDILSVNTKANPLAYSIAMQPDKFFRFHQHTYIKRRNMFLLKEITRDDIVGKTFQFCTIPVILKAKDHYIVKSRMVPVVDITDGVANPSNPFSVRYFEYVEQVAKMYPYLNHPDMMEKLTASNTIAFINLKELAQAISKNEASGDDIKQQISHYLDSINHAVGNIFTYTQEEVPENTAQQVVHQGESKDINEEPKDINDVIPVNTTALQEVQEEVIGYRDDNGKFDYTFLMLTPFNEKEYLNKISQSENIVNTEDANKSGKSDRNNRKLIAPK